MLIGVDLCKFMRNKCDNSTRSRGGASSAWFRSSIRARIRCQHDARLIYGDFRDCSIKGRKPWRLWSTCSALFESVRDFGDYLLTEFSDSFGPFVSHQRDSALGHTQKKMAQMQLGLHRKASTPTECGCFTFPGAGSDVRTARRSSKSRLFNE